MWRTEKQSNSLALGGTERLSDLFINYTRQTEKQCTVIFFPPPFFFFVVTMVQSQNRTFPCFPLLLTRMPERVMPSSWMLVMVETQFKRRYLILWFLNLFSKIIFNPQSETWINNSILHISTSKKRHMSQLSSMYIHSTNVKKTDPGDWTG